MQYVRYVVPVLPALLLVGGEGADRFASVRPAVRWAACAAVAVQALLVFGSAGGQLLAGPRGGPGRIVIATDADARDYYLRHQLSSYASEQWLNRSTPTDAGVVLFEEPRGFYLDRPYLWGNGLHSTYIPYPTFGTGRDMAEWFLAHGFRYALVNLQFSQPAATAEGNTLLRQSEADGTVEQLFRQWYTPQTAGERFRRLLGDAVATGAAVVVQSGSLNGNIVLELEPGRGGGVPVGLLGPMGHVGRST
jgi:hypothetical protein